MPDPTTDTPSPSSNSPGKDDPLAFFARLKPHLARLDTFLHEQLLEFESEVRELAAYCIDASGKRIRPALVFFSGWQGDDTVSEDHVRLAAVIEMVHLATLVHDDIMDGATLRRGRPTATEKFGPDTAVLLGDALFAHALHVAAQFPTTAVCRGVSRSTRRVCTGEIMQTLAGENTHRDTAYYRRVIELKTAELFHISCQLGAALAGHPAELADAAGRFGRHLGTAYQIYDDLADFFGDENRIGKTLGTDLASNKATLPLLLLQQRLPTAEADALRDEMATGNTANIRLRIRQMADLRVFADVMAAIEEEIHSAETALAPLGDIESTRLLRQLAAVLKAQAARLRSASS